MRPVPRAHPLVMNSEIRTFSDPISGRTVRQLTRYKGHSHHFYFTNPGWWDGGRRLLFGSDRAGRTNLFSVHLESGEITQHTDQDMPGPPRETSFLYAAAHPSLPECYFWRGEKLIVIDLVSNRERLLWTRPAGHQSNIINVTADGASVCSVIYEDLADRFDYDNLHGYVGCTKYWAAFPRSRIIQVPLDGGASRTVWEEKYWIGHINTSPTQPHLLTFCHEGPWEEVDHRIWMLDMRSGKAWKLRERTMAGERTGHEYWHASGKAIGYHGYYPDGRRFFGAIDYDNANMRELEMEGETGHIHSLDDRLIVGDAEGDDAHPFLHLWGRNGSAYDRPRILCRHDSSSACQQLHVHPRFSADGTRIVFTSDATGYGQVYEVEVGDWTDLPVIDVEQDYSRH